MMIDDSMGDPNETQVATEDDRQSEFDDMNLVEQAEHREQTERGGGLYQGNILRQAGEENQYIPALEP